MIEVKNQFANHLIFWCFALPLVTVLTLPAMLHSDRFVISDNEITFFKEVLDKDTDAVTASADDTFDKIFVKTSIATSVRDFFAPRQTTQTQPVGLTVVASGVSRNYNNALWQMIYRGIWRITGLWSTVLTVLLALALPCLADGLSVRATKSYNFKFHNPVFFWSASHSMILVVGLGVFLPFLPYALSPVIMAGFFVAFSMSLWITAANFQTGN